MKLHSFETEDSLNDFLEENSHLVFEIQIIYRPDLFKTIFYALEVDEIVEERFMKEYERPEIDSISNIR